MVIFPLNSTSESKIAKRNGQHQVSKGNYIDLVLKLIDSIMIARF